MFTNKRHINLFLKFHFLSIIIPIIKSEQINSNENNFNEFSFIEKYISKNDGDYNVRHLDSKICASTSYSKSDIQKECNKGPNSYDRILKYNTFGNYITYHDYHSNGLNYITSLLVDSDTHHYGNFINDCAAMIILLILGGLILISWIPLLYCWRKRCCIFGNCLYEDDCCIVFWHIITYFFAAAIFSFIIVVLVFGT
jgi:hypothetical protein